MVIRGPFDTENNCKSVLRACYILDMNKFVNCIRKARFMIYTYMLGKVSHFYVSNMPFLLNTLKKEAKLHHMIFSCPYTD